MAYHHWDCWIVALVLGTAGLTGCERLPLRFRQGDAQQPTLLLNTTGDARWSATTWEAASTPKQRKVLERARPKILTGEVVDVSCFLQLGKRGEAHIPCGQKCVRNGQPIGLLTDREQLYLIIPEEHHPRRDGQVSLKDRFAELMGKRVTISGMVTTYNDYRVLFVQTLPTDH